MNFITDLLRRKPVIIQILRFAAIGALNTALDFVILNFITKSFDVTSGVSLGALNVISFAAAVIQSYFWNKAWTFAEGKGITVFQNAFRLFIVGGLGFVTFLAVFLGAAYDASNMFFLLVLVGFVVIELILWKAFNFGWASSNATGTSQFTSFLIVSIVGLVINSVIVVVASKYITPYLEFSINADTIKNVAKVLATVVSLVWNFIGYKLIVFKR